MVALVLAALAVGLGNFAVAVGIGLSGVDARVRVTVAAVFGAFEAGMPLVGLLLGHRIAHGLGDATAYVGGALLAVIGVLTLAQEMRRGDSTSSTKPISSRPISSRPGSLALTALVLSTDNVVVGFGLGVSKTPLLEAVVVFGAVSVALTLAGLQFGHRLGTAATGRSGSLAGLVLIGVGILIALKVF